MNDLSEYINTNLYNTNYSYDIEYFTTVSEIFKSFYSGCETGKTYWVKEMQGEWLLSICTDGCGKCKSCIGGVWVNKSSGFICYL